jgi:hypothetical protein
LEANNLLQAALDYATWAKGHPIVVSRIVGGERVAECHDRPLTFEGFITHSRIDPGLIETTRANAPGIFQAIRALFFDQQYSRAAIGEYDRRLVASYFGLGGASAGRGDRHGHEPFRRGVGRRAGGVDAGCGRNANRADYERKWERKPRRRGKASPTACYRAQARVKTADFRHL